MVGTDGARERRLGFAASLGVGGGEWWRRVGIQTYAVVDIVHCHHSALWEKSEIRYNTHY